MVGSSPSDPDPDTSKHDTLSQCWPNVGPPPMTLTNLGPVLGQCLLFSEIPRWATRLIVFPLPRFT